MQTEYRRFVCGLLLTVAVSGCVTNRPFAKRDVPQPTALAASSVQPPVVQTAAYLADQPSDTTANSTPTVASSPAPTTQAVQPPSHLSGAEELPGLAPEASDDACRLDMSTALALVAGQNPQVGYARWRIREAYANLEQAHTLWLPSIQAGASFYHHEGALQDAPGNILGVSRSSLQTGLGAGAVGTSTTPYPGIIAKFHLVDAIFQPAIAQRSARAQEHARDAVLNDQLLEAAVAYQELLRAYQLRAVALQTVKGTQELVRLTTDYANAGQGTRADADRSLAELALCKNNVTRGDESVAVASARLAQVLSLNSVTQIVPVEETLVPIDLLPASGNPSTPSVPSTSSASSVPPHLPDPSEELAIALANRPELKESHDLVAAATARLRRERYAPLVPSVLLDASYDAFGGGMGDTIADVNDRADFDAIAFWQIRNLGFGEQAARHAANARFQEETMRQIRVMDTIAREVAEANARVRTRFALIATSMSGVESARQSFDRNFTRIREGQGLPIEVLQAVQSLDTSQRELVDATADYNIAQFQLQRALGWPVQ